MQYGYFDDHNKEYVITRPDTPKPWSNYLGNTQYGAIITNNAGGYSFYKSGGMGRFMRLRFNSVPLDQPGRYLYWHDKNTRDYWSASWQPVGKPLVEFKSECRHGTAYTIITSEYKGIKTQKTYYVPVGKNYEVWHVKVTNTGSTTRFLRGYTYVEYAANWNAIDDLLNLQYVQYISMMDCVDGIIDHATNINIPEMPDNFKEKDQERRTFQTIAGIRSNGFDTDRERFIGPYRTYQNPLVVESGECGFSRNYGDNPCGSLQYDIELQPGRSKEFVVLMGPGNASIEGKKVRDIYQNLGIVEKELQELKDYWHSRMKGFSAQTPDPELNSTINTWGIYNSLITFAWSRAASLIYSGIDRDGLGYRDTVQDFMGVMHAIPQDTRERLELMITGQVSTGGAMPVVLPISHSPGNEKAPEEEHYRSDDSLWLFNAVPAYVKETGDISFYNKILPYADKGEATVLGHLRRAIEFSIQRSGAHGLPCGLSADWNDCLKFGQKGESVFVAMQLRLALSEYIDICEILNQSQEIEWAHTLLQQLDRNLQSHAWDGEWFMRGYRFDGMKFGSKDVSEGQIFLNTQTWAVISGAATPDQAIVAMQKVNERLATEYGLALCDPPYTSSDYNIVRAQLFNPGLKENGGIFVHTQGWGVMAETMLGNGNRAYQYLRAYLPAAYNQKAEIREIEPYVVSQSTHTQYSPKFGASRVPWLSGSATWTYYAITQYILGIRPEYNGITIDPCIPDQWKNYTVSRLFRGKLLNITVENPQAVEKGVKITELNGKPVHGNYIPVELLEETNEIKVIMG
jgi:N,N'-diacetylchitobiose phosphorylase